MGFAACVCTSVHVRLVGKEVCPASCFPTALCDPAAALSDFQDHVHEHPDITKGPFVSS